ncbi:MAG TPA: hypothetical protein VFS21_29475 [Roseiflexaceae bacterium]|nr:hypothetical protein [Roseiflexaceae bacterium]
MSDQPLRRRRQFAPEAERQNDETPQSSLLAAPAAPALRQDHSAVGQQSTLPAQTAAGLGHHIGQIGIFADDVGPDSPALSPVALSGAPAGAEPGSDAAPVERASERPDHTTAPLPASDPGPTAQIAATVAATPSFAPLVGVLAEAAPSQIGDTLGQLRQAVGEQSATNAPLAAQQHTAPVSEPSTSGHPTQERAPLESTALATPHPQVAGPMQDQPTMARSEPQGVSGEPASSEALHSAAQQPIPTMPRPKTPLAGATDPQQVGNHTASAQSQIQARREAIEARVGEDLEAAVPEPTIAATLPTWPEPQQPAFEPPARPVAALSSNLGGALDSGQAADFFQRLPAETAPKLAPFFIDAANAQMQQHLTEEITAYQRDEQGEQSRLAGLRASTEQRLQEHQTAALAEQSAVREQTRNTVRTKRQSLQQSNRRYDQQLQELAGAQQRQTQSQIQTIAQQRERSADTVLTDAERQATERRAQAEQQASQIIADAQQSSAGDGATLVQRQTATAEPVDPLRQAREEADAILAQMRADVDALLAEAGSKSKEEIQAAIQAIQEQIAAFRLELEGYAGTIGQEMELNGATILTEIDTALGEAEAALAAINTRLSTDQAVDLAALQRDLGTLQTELTTDVTALMNRIDTRAQVLEPMYAYCRDTGACEQPNVDWIGVDCGFMSNLLGGNPGTIYFPYHTNAQDIFQRYRSAGNGAWDPSTVDEHASVANDFFPWEAMASVAYSEQSTLHPFAPGLTDTERAAFGQNWIGETMGIFQTMIVRASPDEGRPRSWSEHMSSISQHDQYVRYGTDYLNPNNAALWDASYANSGFSSFYPGQNNQILQEFYALGAAMFFTGQTIDQPYGFFSHSNQSDDLRGTNTDTTLFGPTWGEVNQHPLPPNPSTIDARFGQTPGAASGVQTPITQPSSTPLPATPTPTPSPYPFDAGLAGQSREVSQGVASNGPGHLVVRSEPNFNAATIANTNQLVPGATVALTGYTFGTGQSTWVQISTPVSGWAFGGYLYPAVQK